MEAKLAAGAAEGALGAYGVGLSPDVFDRLVRLHQRRIHRILLAMHVRAEAERPETFFRAQRAGIIGRLDAPRFPSRRWQIAWAPAVAAPLILFVLLTRGGSPLDPARDLGPDQTILSTVQHAIHAEVPTALQPAALLTTEVERGLSHPDRGDASTKGDRS
jgi:hypothetical protein